MKNKLPNFLIVGAAKCGTSSLHNYLNQHPDIFMPSFNKEGVNVKEPQFLIKNQVKERLHFGIWKWEEYKSLFNKTEKYKAVGESSVFYLHFYKEAIKNIKEKLGHNIKIIIMLRNPVDRAYSAYQHVARGLVEQLTFEQALKIENKRLEKDKSLTPMVLYKEMGMYYEMVKAYSESFNDVFIILHEDFSNNTDKVLKNVFQFLEVNQNQKIDYSKRHNVGGTRWKSNSLKKILMKENKFKRLLKRILPKMIKNKIWEKLSKASTNKVKPMKKETREFLNNYFQENIIKLSNLIDENLTLWKK